MKTIAKIACGLIALLLCVQSEAFDTCQGHFVNPITDIDWNGLFPMTIGDAEVIPGDAADTSNPSNPICTCPLPVGWKVGLTIGYWEPIALADVTATPYCMVNLGFQMELSSVGRGGEGDPTQASGRNAFYWVHWYKYPLMYWLNLLTSASCMDEGEFDVAYLSELDPTWNDSEAAFVFNPESVLFTSLLTQAACAADSTASLVGLPIDDLFWCMGSQGSSYPINGRVQDQHSFLQAAVLDVERMDFKLHREGLIFDSVGENSPAVCSQQLNPILPKSRYRYEQVNVQPDATSVHPFGQLVSTWDIGHHTISDGDNAGFLVWRKRNCCFL